MVMLPLLLLFVIAGLHALMAQPTVDIEAEATSGTGGAGCQQCQTALQEVLTKIDQQSCACSAPTSTGTSDGGPSTDPDGILVQQHYAGSTIFNASWAQFKAGFGNTTGDYWIGNDRLYELTRGNGYKLRVDIQAAFNGGWYWAEYSWFSVGPEASKYVLHIGGFSGTAGDAMTVDGNTDWSINGMRYTTYDSDNDRYSQNCANYSTMYKLLGGFWYNKCGYACLNQVNIATTDIDDDAVTFSWRTLPIGTRKSYYTTLSYSRMTLLPK